LATRTLPAVGCGTTLNAPSPLSLWCAQNGSAQLGSLRFAHGLPLFLRREMRGGGERERSVGDRPGRPTATATRRDATFQNYARFERTRRRREMRVDARDRTREDACADARGRAAVLVREVVLPSSEARLRARVARARGLESLGHRALARGRCAAAGGVADEQRLSSGPFHTKIVHRSVERESDQMLKPSGG
jgi:hypothetical protein